MLHKKGNIFQRTSQGAVSQIEYREAIAAALSHELGGAGRATKVTSNWAGVTERTAKNWILGSNGPSGEHLLELMRHSDVVLAVVLGLAGRTEALAALRVGRVRHELKSVLKDLDVIYGSQEEEQARLTDSRSSFGNVTKGKTMGREK